jgi:hypothetical protein
MNLGASATGLLINLGEAIATSDCDVTGSYVDWTQQTRVPACVSAGTNGTTPVTAVPAPPSGTQRIVEEVRLYNNDTIPHAVYLMLSTVNAPNRVVKSGNVWPGSSFVYIPGANDEEEVSLAGLHGAYAVFGTISWGGGAIAQAGTITVAGNFEPAGHLLAATFNNGSGGGSIVAEVTIGGTAVTGLSAVTINAPGTVSATGLNGIPWGGTLAVVFSAASGTISNGGYLTLTGVYD